jgi:ribosomal protein L24
MFSLICREFSTKPRPSTTAKRVLKKAVGTKRVGNGNYYYGKIETNWSIFKGDLVQVINPKALDADKQGIVSHVNRINKTIMIPKMNVKEFEKNTHSPYFKPITVTEAYPYDLSDVELVNPQSGKPITSGLEWRKLTIDGITKTIRICKELGNVIPIPPPWLPDRITKSIRRPGLYTTLVDEVQKITYEKHPLYGKDESLLLMDRVKARHESAEEEYKNHQTFYEKANLIILDLKKQKNEKESTFT